MEKEKVKFFFAPAFDIESLPEHYARVKWEMPLGTVLVGIYNADEQKFLIGGDETKTVSPREVVSWDYIDPDQQLLLH